MCFSDTKSLMKAAPKLPTEVMSFYQINRVLEVFYNQSQQTNKS